MSAADLSAIAFVSALRHRVGGRRLCKCERCRSLVRVAVLAKQAVQIKAALRPARFKPVRERRGKLEEWENDQWNVVGVEAEARRARTITRGP